MAYASYETVARRWVGAQTGDTTRVPANRRMIAEGPRIYSYGHHFELARTITDPTGTTILFLLNGDRVSPTTSRHQAEVRAAVGSHPHVIVPYSALGAAGIDLDSVGVLDSRPDGWEATQHICYEPPAGSVWREVVTYGDVELSPAELEQVLDREHRYEMERWEQLGRWHEDCPDLWADPGEPPQRGTVESIPDWQRTERRKIGTARVLYRNARTRWATIDVSTDETGRAVYSWESGRHWLGASLIEADVAWSRTVTCRLCKGNGRDRQAPAQPSIGVEWIGDESAADRQTRRDEAWRALREWEERWEGSCPRCEGRGRWVRQGRRHARFLSAFDEQEKRASYFFCELPPSSKAATIEQAYEDLKPETVKLAEQMGRTPKRQGDIFAVPLPGLDKRTLRKAGARFERRGSLLATNHVGTEVAYLPDGTTLARGCLTHAPDGRRPDHARVRLGDQFHVVVKNTVPISV